jgi:uncharacterized protein YjbJ (UPF0337 family)
MLAGSNGCRGFSGDIFTNNSTEENTTMNWDQIEGNWKKVKGKVKEKWGKLTDDELDVLAGKKDQLIGKIQERYGIAKSEAAKQVEDFGRTCEIETSSTSSSRRP